MNTFNLRPATTLDGVDVSMIINEVAKIWGVTAEGIKGDSRPQPLAFARQVSMALVRRLLRMSVVDIGTAFGKDHTTVTYAVKRVDQVIAQDEEIKACVEDVISKLSRYGE